MPLYRRSFRCPEQPAARLLFVSTSARVLSANLAVLRWKRYLTVFADLSREHNTIYAVDGNDILNGDH